MVVFQLGALDSSSTGYIKHLWLGNLKAFAGQCRDIISPGPPPSWMHLEDLPLQLAPLNVKEQHFYSRSSQMTKFLTLPHILLCHITATKYSLCLNLQISFLFSVLILLFVFFASLFPQIAFSCNSSSSFIVFILAKTFVFECCVAS